MLGTQVKRVMQRNAAVCLSSIVRIDEYYLLYTNHRSHSYAKQDWFLLSIMMHGTGRGGEQGTLSRGKRERLCVEFPFTVAVAMIVDMNDCPLWTVT